MKPSRRIPAITIILIIAVMPLLSLSFLLIPQASADNDYRTVKTGESVKYGIGGDPEDTFSIDFSISNGSTADLYIMTKNEYETNYDEGRGFNTTFEQERVDLLNDEKWTRPDDQTYYLVVDNKDNARSSDAVPEGNITDYVNYFNETQVEEFLEDFFDAGSKVLVACCAVIIIVIIAVIWLVTRNNKSDTVVIQQPPRYPPGQPPIPPPPPPPAPLQGSVPPPIPGQSPDLPDRRPPQP